MKMQFSFVLSLCICLNLNAQSRIGIDTDSPSASLHIKANSDNKDPLVLTNIKDVADASSTTTNDSYLNLKISANGVVRTEAPKSNVLKSLNLANSFTITETGGSQTGGGHVLKWLEPSATSGEGSQYITLPEDGSYIFSFRLYGKSTSLGRGASHYLSAYKYVDGLSDNLVSVVEIYISIFGVPNNMRSDNVSTYSVRMNVSGKAGNKVYFKIARYGGYDDIKWTLWVNTGISANRTSLIFWKQ